MADGPRPGRRSSTGLRSGLPAIAVMLAFLAAGLATGIGAGRAQAAGLGLVVLGITLWLGTLSAAPTAPALGSDDERSRRQRHRSLAIALGLGGLVVIFYVATLVRLGPNALRKEGMLLPGTGNVIPATDPAVCKKAGTC